MLDQPKLLPENYSDLMEELALLRALEVNRKRQEKLNRCNGESGKPDSPVHPAPNP